MQQFLMKKIVGNTLLLTLKAKVNAEVVIHEVREIDVPSGYTVTTKQQEKMVASINKYS